MGNMILLDIVIGYYLPSLFGWAFLVFVLAAESFLLSKYLKKYWVDKNIFTSVIISNLITTIIGYLLLGEESGFGLLLNWIPIEYYGGKMLVKGLILLLTITFIGSLIVETLSNWIFLRRLFTFKKIFLGTLWINIFTYIIGGITFYLYDMLVI